MGRAPEPEAGGPTAPSGPGPAPKVSLSLLNFNGGANVDRCVDAILRLRGAPFEVIAVDNASTDGSGARLSARFSEHPEIPFRYLPRPRNDGFGAAHNASAALARGRYLAFVNVTVRLEPDWLFLAEWMDAHPDVAIAFGPVLHAEEPDRIESLGGIFDPYGRLTVVGHNRRAGSLSRGGGPLAWEVGSVLGAAFMARKPAFDQLGGFDPSLFLYFDESELCWRAWRSGWRCAFSYDPARPMRAYHARHGTLPRELDRLRMANTHRTDVWVRYSDHLGPGRLARHFLMATDDLYRRPRSLFGYLWDVMRRAPSWPARRRETPPAKVPESRYLNLPVPKGFESWDTLEAPSGAGGRESAPAPEAPA